jgi:predicted ATPase
MKLTFYKGLDQIRDSKNISNIAILTTNNWDDYGFKSSFYLEVYDETGIGHKIGSLKIGYFGQVVGWTEQRMPDRFEKLDDNFFSVGQDTEYYINIQENLSSSLKEDLINGLRDLPGDEQLLESASNEKVLNVSLLRYISSSAIKGQFKRILSGGALLTEFNFSYKREERNQKGRVDLNFRVIPSSNPPTNIHILIGRNGVGKTTLLNDIVMSVIGTKSDSYNNGNLYELSEERTESIISDDYFSSLVLLSFSSFDLFIPPSDQKNDKTRLRYFYIGLQKQTINESSKKQSISKSRDELCQDFINSLKMCVELPPKKNRWLNAIQKLESDMNFAEMELGQLTDLSSEVFNESAQSKFLKMSSGHAVVLLSITKLVETVEEKTLVLVDEPECHLHPPLLSAFIRALSDLLINRNGVAIIATHSPVVLQEVPKSCVWRLRRIGIVSDVERPESETFGENVGILTREVFGLEVNKSGFHQLLEESVKQGKSYQQVVDEYGNQIGYEGMAILRALINRRDAI